MTKTETYRINRPVAFEGTEEEREANFATHLFFYSMDPNEAGDTRCGNCDCRPSHVAASYPCGTTVPREVVEFEVEA